MSDADHLIDGQILLFSLPLRSALRGDRDRKTGWDIMIRCTREQRALWELATSTDQAVRLARQRRPAAIIVDNVPPDSLGALITALAQPDVPLLLVSDQPVLANRFGLLRLGISHVIPPDLEWPMLVELIREHRRARAAGHKAILLKASELELRSSLSRELKDSGHVVYAFDSLRGMETAWWTPAPDLVMAVVGNSEELATVQHLRRASRRAGVPCLVLGELSEAETRTHFAAGEASEHLRLPALPGEVLSRVERALGSRRDPLAPLPSAMATGAKGSRVLLADDDRFVRRLLGHHLRRAGFVVDEAHDGEQALRLLAERGYSLALLEELLPFYTAGELLKRLRAEHPSVETRFVLMSERGRSAGAMRSLSWGADEFIAKPLDPYAVVARLSQLLELR